MERAIFKMNFDCGRSGSLAGVFVQEKEMVKVLVESGMDIYFGEVLGKHSEVYGPLKESEITMLTDSPEVVDMFVQHGLSSGFDPFEYTTLSRPEGAEEEDDMLVSEACEFIINNRKLIW